MTKRAGWPSTLRFGANVDEASTYLTDDFSCNITDSRIHCNEITKDAKKACNKVLLPIKLLYFAIAFSLYMSSYTLYSNYGGNGKNLRMLATLGITIAILFLLVRKTVAKKAMLIELSWVCMLVATYLIVGMNSSSWGGITVLIFFVCLSICPLFIYLLMLSDNLVALVTAFVNITCIFAVASIVLWLTGPILNIVQSNCTIPNTWNGTGIMQYSPGYYRLLYVVQHSKIPDLSIVRNTGIFVEAPMYSYILCCSLLLEEYWGQRRKYVEFSLILTVCSTISITGIILILLFIFFKEKYRFNSASSFSSKIFRFLMVLALSVLMTYLATVLLTSKMETMSGSMRIDDFAAGYKAWIQKPLLGFGFGDWDIYQSYISAFRSHNVGYSNSIMPVLMSGGIFFGLLHVLCYVTMIVSRNVRLREYAVLYLFLWAFTIVWNLPLTVLMLSFGLGYYMFRSCNHA